MKIRNHPMKTKLHTTEAPRKRREKKCNPWLPHPHRESIPLFIIFMRTINGCIITPASLSTFSASSSRVTVPRGWGWWSCGEEWQIDPTRVPSCPWAWWPRELPSRAKLLRTCPSQGWWSCFPALLPENLMHRLAHLPKSKHFQTAEQVHSNYRPPIPAEWSSNALRYCRLYRCSRILGLAWLKDKYTVKLTQSNKSLTAHFHITSQSHLLINKMHFYIK